MEISEEKVADRSLVIVSGRLDTGTVVQFDRSFGAIVDWDDHRLVPDLSQLQNTSRAGLRTILSFARQFKDLDGGPAIGGPADVVQGVFTVSGIDALIPMLTGVEEAPSAI